MSARALSHSRRWHRQLWVVCGVVLGLAGAAAARPLPGPHSGPGDQAGATPTFAVGVRNVNLEVQVTRGGRRVPGLTASAFVVTDNGVRQQVEILSQEESPVDTVLALDASSSVSGRRLAALQAAAHEFVDALWPMDSVALVGFATDLRLAARPGVSRAEVHATIDRFRGNGATMLNDAVYASLLVTDPVRGRPLVIIFSDGRDRGSWLSPELVQAVLRASDAVVDSIVVGDEDRSFLQDAARDTGGRTFIVRGDHELGEAFLSALDDFRSRYRLRYEPRGVRRGGWHAIRVKLAGKKGSVLARRGYQAEAGK
jgi:VWFA-related protein